MNYLLFLAYISSTDRLSNNRLFARILLSKQNMQKKQTKDNEAKRKESIP
jgi:hypothetical protein